MTPIPNNLRHSSICSCFPALYQNIIYNKIKWSTLCIGTALLIIIVYLSSGLHALVDLTAIITKQSSNSDDEEVLWPITTSSLMTIYGWLSISIYFIVVLLVILLITGIQLRKSWLLFLWSMIMIFMLLADGIITVLSLHEQQKQNYRPAKQIKLLFFVMSVRLIVSLCGIFFTIFYFRCLNNAQSDELIRQKILDRYNAGSPTPSHHDSWATSAPSLDTPKDRSDERFTIARPPTTLPRANVVPAIHYQPEPVFYSYKQQSAYLTRSERPAMRKYNDNFRYKIPLQERFHQQELRDFEDD